MEAQWNLRLALTAAWTAAGTALYLVLPMSAAYVAPLAVVMPILWRRPTALLSEVKHWSPLFLLLAVTSVYLLINASWSFAANFAYRGAIEFLILTAVLFVVTRTVPSLEGPPLRAMAVGFFASYSVLGVPAAYESITGFHLHRLVLTAFPHLDSDSMEAIIEDGVIRQLPDFYLNHTMSALMFLLWPAMSIAARLGRSPEARAAMLVCLAPAAMAILLGGHTTSKFALAGSALVYCFAIIVPRATGHLLAATWVGAWLLAVPLAVLAYDSELFLASWIPHSAQHRIVIWKATSDRVSEAPVLGHGLASARALTRIQEQNAGFAPHTRFPLTVGHHAHNMYLQGWFEAGAVGVILLLTIGVLVLHRINRVERALRPAFLAAFTGNAIIAAAAFSMWSPWFLASNALTAIFAILSYSLAMQSNVTASPPATQLT